MSCLHRAFPIILAACLLYAPHAATQTPSAPPDQAQSRAEDLFRSSLTLLQSAAGLAPDQAGPALEQAAKGFEQSAAAFARLAQPLPALTARINQGLALQLLAQLRHKDDAMVLLRQSVQTLRAANDVSPPETTPELQDLARSTLAISLAQLGMRLSPEPGRRLLQESIDCFRASAAFRKQGKDKVSWLRAEMNLATTIQELAEREEGEQAAAHFREAISAYRGVIAAMPPEQRGTLAAVWNNLANAQSGLALAAPHEQAEPLLRESVDSVRKALALTSRQDAPFAWGQYQIDLCYSLMTWAGVHGPAGSAALLDQAASACEAALQVFSPNTAPTYYAKARPLLARVQRMRAEATPASK